MYVVALAGGIASGKSTVARLLESWGALRVDLDVLSREVCEPGSPTLSLIADKFGPEVIEGSGVLNRAALARAAFCSPQTTRALESIVHPAIFERLRQILALPHGESVCVVEVPLLDRIEDRLADFDEVVCVVCDQCIRIERAVERGMQRDDVLARMQSQPSDAYLRAHAHTVLVNDGNRDELEQQVARWWASRATKDGSRA